MTNPHVHVQQNEDETKRRYLILTLTLALTLIPILTIPLFLVIALVLSRKASRPLARDFPRARSLGVRTRALRPTNTLSQAAGARAYDYLLRMPILSLSAEHAARLELDRDRKRVEAEELRVRVPSESHGSQP